MLRVLQVCNKQVDGAFDQQQIHHALQSTTFLYRIIGLYTSQSSPLEGFRLSLSIHIQHTPIFYPTTNQDNIKSPHTSIPSPNTLLYNGKMCYIPTGRLYGLASRLITPASTHPPNLSSSHTFHHPQVHF